MRSAPETFVCDGCGEQMRRKGSVVTDAVLSSTGEVMVPARRYHDLNCWMQHGDAAGDFDDQADP